MNYLTGGQKRAVQALISQAFKKWFGYDCELFPLTPETPDKGPEHTCGRDVPGATEFNSTDCPKCNPPEPEEKPGPSGHCLCFYGSNGNFFESPDCPVRNHTYHGNWGKKMPGPKEPEEKPGEFNPMDLLPPLPIFQRETQELDWFISEYRKALIKQNDRIKTLEKNIENYKRP